MASIVWTKHLEGKDKENFLNILMNSTTVLNRLQTLLKEELDNLDNQECTVKDFEDPSWSHKQAFRNGERARIRKTLDLITLRK